ncbi:MAG: GGDEF domain-containing protein [Alphaproteobacteria bacterium]|nr:sensor domain-containing diguanylate cyclase [Alphaproteobacteria bacterium]MDE2336407.1 GGDEF domain-containing protein [Alphaproteobacteria bacterium]
MFYFGKKKLLSDVSAAIVERFEDGIVAIDSHHCIILFNEGASRIFGYAPEEVMGRHLNILLPERFHLQHDLMIEEFGAAGAAVKKSSHRSRQVFGRRKNGEEFEASIFIINTGLGGLRPGYAAVVRDISEDKRTEDELMRLAATDPLTGAFNRREFKALADEESLRANRYNRPLSIMMLDLDHFKRLNDTYGHAAGDKALQRFTTLCCNALRTIDIFGRWGGEEFVTLLPETDAEGAVIIAERLRKLVNQSLLVFNEHKISITASIGIAQYRAGELTVEGPLSRADSAVYDAKKAGRNRISVYRND